MFVRGCCSEVDEGSEGCILCGGGGKVDEKAKGEEDEGPVGALGEAHGNRRPIRDVKVARLGTRVGTR